MGNLSGNSRKKFKAANRGARQVTEANGDNMAEDIPDFCIAVV